MEYLKYLAVIFCVVGAYLSGFASGSNEKELEYFKQKQELELEYKVKEQNYLNQIKEADKALYVAKEEYEANISNLKSLHADELLKSQQRAEAYKRTALSGEAQCRSLAEYTAKLDRTLTEGRELVKELRDTLKLRDKQLVEVGNYLVAGDKLYD